MQQGGGSGQMRQLRRGQPTGETVLTRWVGHYLYLERVVAALRARGEEVPEEYPAHLSPLEWEHVTLTGVYRWDLGEEP